MKYIKAYENDKITVKIKPNIKNKDKWYYGWLNYKNNLTDKIITVTKSDNPSFDNCYCYDASHYIDIDDCELIGININKYNI
jgi:hypothetical protein